MIAAEPFFWARPADDDPRRRRQVPGDRRSRPNGETLHAFRASISAGGDLFAAPSAFADEFAVGEQLDVDQATAAPPDALTDAKTAMPFSRGGVFAYEYVRQKPSAVRGGGFRSRRGGLSETGFPLDA